MNCRACHDLLQQHLDGGGDPAALGGHLRDCPGCAALHRAATRLGQGLRLLTPPAPPAGLADRIVARVRHERLRRRGFRRRAALALAVAASLLVAVAVRTDWPRTAPVPPPAPGPGPVARTTPPLPGPAPKPATLRESVAEAGSAVASLTSRTADETVGQTRLFVPDLGAPPLGGLEPPTRPLWEAGEGVTEGLEPVTSSARRAVGLFLRDLPPMGPGEEPGL